MMRNSICALLVLASIASAHMHLYFPPTLKGDNNPYTNGSADPLLNYPYGCCGKAVPGLCKGHLDLLDTPEGQPTAQWAAGQKANFSLSGAAINTPTYNPVGGNHFGGSCQAGFSTDGGKTFKVVQSWQGNCPLRNNGEDPSNQVFDFTVPADMPAGKAVFAWTWVNRETEFNMNCAAVTIASSDSSEPDQSASPSAAPSATQSYAPQPTASQYELQGCTCSCPSQTWTAACTCKCDSSAKRRHLVERQAFEMHKRAMENAEKLKAPLRRTETVAFNNRPNMLTSIDYEGATCQTTGDTTELEWPNPGPDVVKGDGEYPLATPACSS